MGWIINRFFKQGKVLLYADAFERRYTPWVVENYKSVLSDLGVRFWYRQDFFFASGFELLMAGAMDAFAVHVEENLALLKKKGIGQIIVCSDEAYFVLKQYYEGIEVIHALDLIAEAKDKLTPSASGEVVYYDSLYLRNMRYRHNPRAVLHAVGCRVREYPEKKGIFFATGSEALLSYHSPRCASRIALEMLRRIEGETLVVASPRAYHHLKEYGDIHDVEIKEISEFLVEI